MISFDVGFLTTVFVSTFCCMAAGLYVAYLLRHEDREAKRRYESTWYCMRCAHKFIPE